MALRVFIMPTFLVGLSFSLLIEIGQIFTMYRQTDVNDLLMNTLGVMIG
ncbi:VanZ family protein [Vagococcus teuberi]|nr:VanZ family protein [Vagococcus teuberi]